MSSINTNVFGRTSTLMSSQSLLSVMTDTQQRLLALQNQIATGVKVTRPSQALADTATIQQLQRQLEQRDQWDRNLQHASGALNSADAALGSATDILLETKSIAMSQIGIGSTAAERSAQAEVVGAKIDALVEIGNRRYSDVSLFGGTSSGEDERVFVNFMGGVRYVGATEQVKGLLGMDDPLSFNSDGSEAFGALSTRVEGTVDLNPLATAETRLIDVNGAQGQGIRQGVVLVNVNGTETVVDLTDADNLGDVVTRINNVLGADGTLAVTGSGYTLTSAGATIAIADTQTGETAKDLGIEMTQAGVGAVVGGDLDPRLTEMTRVDPPASFFGAALDLTGGLRLSQGEVTKVADFSTAQTIEDMQIAVDRLDMGLRLEINETGTGLNLISDVSGIDLSIGETLGGTTAQSLGLRSMGTETLLADFNFGEGVNPVTKQPASTFVDDDGKTITLPAVEYDFAVNLSDGSTVNVDMSGAVTVQDAVDRIAAAAAAVVPAITVGGPGSGADFEVGLVQEGNGFHLADNLGGAGTIEVVALGQSHVAEELGLDVAAGAGNVILGSNASKARVDGVFTHLINLQQALRGNDETGIQFAADKLDSDVEHVTRAQASIGVRGQRVQQQQERSAELRIAEEALLSGLRDTDMTEAITQYLQLTQQLQASLQVGSSNLQTSLLNYLR